MGEGSTAINAQHMKSYQVREGTLDRQLSRKVLGNKTNQPTLPINASNSKKNVNRQYNNSRQKSNRPSGVNGNPMHSSSVSHPSLN